MPRAVFAFSRDLRLNDHAGLAAAGRHGEVVPVHVVDPVSAARLRRSPRRAAYYCAAVAALDAALRERGSGLIVRRGNPGQVLRALARAVGAGVVSWSCGYDAKSIRRDRDLQSTLEEAGLRVVPVHDAPAVPPEESAAGHSRGDGYRAFVPYHALWRTLIPVDDAGGATFAASEVAS
jgi:deoxyribodipyrimidine photo-lyase